MRFARDKTPMLTTPETPFEIGKAVVLWKTEKPQVTIFTTGPLSYNTMHAARELEKENIYATIVNVHTIKPLDEETIVREAKISGAVVTYEEHQINGGLGGAIAELLAKKCPLPIEMIGMKDCYGQSGTPDELVEHYGMGVSHIVEAAKRSIVRAIK